MKRAFTIVELLITVVVIVTLLAISFRIANVGGEASRRNTTIHRLQRMENALSGYFAAFGSYPPVPVYESRNVYAGLDANGEQDGSADSSLNANSVLKACRAQPVAARFPYSSDKNDYVESVSKVMSERANSDDDQWKAFRARASQLGGGFTALNNPNQVSKWKDDSTWANVKIFQFGVMSFLLPRYMFMTSGIDPQDLDDCKQWNDNNRLASHQNTGKQFSNWQDQMSDKRLVLRIPSQAACARWMPNFAGIVRGSECGREFFGVNIHGGLLLDPDDPYSVEVYVKQNRTVLDALTVTDGWGMELFYYSAPPYQSYRLWSAGPNMKTFPPWVPFDSLKNDADRKTAGNWMADDIMYLNN